MVASLDIGQWATGLIPSSGTVMSLIRSLVIFVGIIIIGTIIFFIINWKKKQKKGNLVEIGWWEEITENMIPLTVDKAEEIIIPGTSLRVFYIKSKDMWLPRFTRPIKPKLFWVVITPNREIVNWTPKPIGKDMKEAGLNYDHTDMRWAAENTKDWIKRNFRDKSTPWWREYKGVIAGVAYILVTTFCLGVILYLWKGLVNEMGGITAQLGKQCMQVMGQGVANNASGVIQVP